MEYYGRMDTKLHMHPLLAHQGAWQDGDIEGGCTGVGEGDVVDVKLFIVYGWTLDKPQPQG